MSLNINDKAPDFRAEAIDHHGNVFHVSLSDYLGKNHLVLFFYPKDDTPGCSKESCGFRDLEAEFKKFNGKILGVSPDDTVSHIGFIEKFVLPYPLIADTERALCNDFEIYDTDQGYLERASFLIGKDGMIKQIWRNVKVELHVEAVLEELKAL